MTGTTRTLTPDRPFIREPVPLHVQTVVYNNDRAALARSFESIDRAVRRAIETEHLVAASVAYGDCSPEAIVDDLFIDELRACASAVNTVRGVFFNANLGTSRAHNRLIPEKHNGLTLIMNPDVVLAPDAIIELIRPFREAGIGITEARQLPIEHLKDYDHDTGETSWASGAAMMIPTALYQALGGFDEESFFLYCDDVDLSWRVRLAGYKIIFQPSAAAFHDKRLTPSGSVLASDAERYYSAEAALLMAHKWSRPDLVRQQLHTFSASPRAEYRRAMEVFLERRASGTLPMPLDPEHRVGQFLDGNYGVHRFVK